MNRRTMFVGIVICLALAALASPFASTSPDGLEKVAEEHGIAPSAPLWTRAPIPDYAMPNVSHPGIATGTAGVIGTLVVLALGIGLARLLARRRA